MSVTVNLNEGDLQAALDDLESMYDNIDQRYLKNTLKRKAKPIVTKMKTDSHSTRLASVIGASTSKKNVRDYTAVKIGVIKNNVPLFPTISSYGLAAILEYGTEERFRLAGLVPTGRVDDSRKWLRRSWDSKIRSVLDNFEKTLEKRAMKDVGN